MPQARGGHASRCIIRDRRCVTPVARQGGCGRSRLTRSPRNHGAWHSAHNSFTSTQILLAVQRSHARKTDRDCRRAFSEYESKRHKRNDEHALIKEDCNQDTSAQAAEEPENTDGDQDISAKAAEEPESTDGDIEDDVDVPEPSVRLQEYMCKRMRRKALLAWVAGKVQEISREDADEPDEEEIGIRSVLMDAIGIASVNVEANLNEVCLDELFAPIAMSQIGDAQRSTIRFADTSMTYFLKLQSDESGMPGLKHSPYWTLDGVVETSVYVDGPSAPVQKWLTV